jgi:hypothetical protein
VWTGIALLGLLPAAGAGAQSGSADAAARVELQLDAMLTADRVLSGTVSDPVWTLTASPGRRLIQLPMRIVAGPAERRYDDPPVDFSGGRFIAWQVPAWDEVSAPSSPAASEGPSEAALMDLEGLLRDLERGEMDGPARSGVGSGGGPGGGPGGGLVDVAAGVLPEEAPRLARSLTLLPDGRVAWPVERGLPNGEVAGGESVFHFYLDRGRLDELEPEQPPRLTREAGETSREYNLRQRAQRAEFNQQRLAYRELVTAVRDTPERLEQPAPPTVWAIFEVSDFGGDWTLRGTPAGDWTMGFDALEALQDLAAGQGLAGGASNSPLSPEASATARTLQRLAADPHPWTQRLLGQAVQRSGAAERATRGGPIFDLFDQLLQAPDTLTRNRAVYALASVRPPTEATAALLQRAAERDGSSVLAQAALRARLGVQWNQDDPLTRRVQSIAVINRALADGGGLDAGRVVAAVLASLPASTTPEDLEALVVGVRFDQVPRDQRAAAVAAALEGADQRPGLVGGWVDRQLLGSADPSLVRLTLELLAEADAPAPLLSAVAGGLTRLVLGPPEALPTPDASKVSLETGLPLTSANHALFKVLNAGDEAVRKLGWSALRQFELTDPATLRGSRPGGAATSGGDPLEMILQAGLGQADTPSSLVPFLLRQPEAAAVEGPLVQVVGRGDVSASARAARALMGSGRDLRSAVQGLTPSQRATLVGRVYQRLGGGEQPVAGLVADEAEGERWLEWFAQRWSEGVLPTAADWSEPVGGRGALLQVAGRPAAEPAAGAIAALAAGAGADVETQRKLIERFKDQRRKLGTAEFESAWDDAQRDIYLLRMADAAGSYVVSIEVESSDDGSAEGAAGGGVESQVIGLIQLNADGRRVQFEGGPELTVPVDTFALRIPTPGELQKFPVEALKQLPLDEVEPPLDLLPQAGGAWSGQVPLPDGRRFGFTLRPATEAEQRSGGVRPKPPAAESPRPRNAFE